LDLVTELKYHLKSSKRLALLGLCGVLIITTIKKGTSKQAGQQTEPTSEILHSTDPTDRHKKTNDSAIPR
jgi:hypothetical protein